MKWSAVRCGKDHSYGFFALRPYRTSDRRNLFFLCEGDAVADEHQAGAYRWCGFISENLCRRHAGYGYPQFWQRRHERFGRYKASADVSCFCGCNYSFAIGAILGGLLFVFGRQFLSLFATEAAVVDVGMQRIRIMAFSYMISAFMDCTIAASRGLGKSVAPTVIVILGSCVFRIAWIYTVFAYFHTIPSLYLLYFFSWTITSVAEILYFVHTWRKMVREGQL